MDAATQAALAQIDRALDAIEPNLEPSSILHGSYDWEPNETRTAHEARIMALATIERLAPPGSAYLADAREHAKSRASEGNVLFRIVGLLHALKSDYEDGLMQTVREFVHADVFADFLEMADALQKQGFKDAAAVIAGSTLEEQLRKLADKHGVSTTRGGKPVKADTINAGLTKATAYNGLVQKQVTAWLDLRNKAAHGHYDDYDHTQVAALVRDIRDFMVRYQA
jgi:hypothetical protein